MTHFMLKAQFSLAMEYVMTDVTIVIGRGVGIIRHGFRSLSTKLVFTNGLFFYFPWIRFDSGKLPLNACEGKCKVHFGTQKI